MTAGKGQGEPEATSETESRRVWRKIRRAVLNALARLALYAVILIIAAWQIMHD